MGAEPAERTGASGDSGAAGSPEHPRGGSVLVISPPSPQRLARSFEAEDIAFRYGGEDLSSKMSSPRETLTHEEALSLLDRAVTYVQARAASPRPFAAGG